MLDLNINLESSEFTTSHALIIGIDDYQSSIPSLKTAVNDASRLAQILEDTFNYQVCLLTESINLKTLRQVLQHDLPQTIGENDRVLFYFAGHGIALNDDDGPAGYIVPQDAQRENRNSFLPMQELHDALTALPCRHLLAIFDCCFAGAFRWAAMRDLIWMPEVVHQERYLRYIRDPAWQVLTSAAYDQQALDVADGMALGLREEQHDHSPFALALFEALNGAGDVVPKGGDGLITATELYLYLREQVESHTEEKNLRQTPGLWPLHKHGKGEFLFQLRELDLPPAPKLTAKNNPYRGLQTFEEKHKDLFFGRSTQIQALAEQVQNHMLTVTVGASGTGKSSLVKAGLLPYLREHPLTGDNDKPEHWEIFPLMRPGENPAAELAKLLLELKVISGQTPIPDQLKNWREQHPGIRLLIVIDQFEELITLCRDENCRKDFIALLQPLIDQSGIHLVFTLRADFEPQVAKYFKAEQWNPARFTAKPMTQDELREVIEGPARERVLYFEPPELVDTLINEVVQTPGALPLLSFTLSELYIHYLERRSDNRALTIEDYQNLGGVIGSLRHRANVEYAALDSAHQASMKRIMLRMIAVEGGELARRRVPYAELVYADEAENLRVEDVLKRLIDARLLVSDENHIEPAHDALVRAWDTLLDWRDAQEEILPLKLQRRLTQNAMDWDHADDSHKKGLLWNNSPYLAQIDSLQVKYKANNNWLNRYEQEFVKQSVALRQKRWRQLWSSVATVFIMLVAGLTTLYWQRNALEYELIKTQYNSGIDDLSMGRIESGMPKIEQAIQNAGDKYPQVIRGLYRHLSSWQEELGMLIEVSSPIDAVAFEQSSEKMVVSTDGEMIVFDRTTGARLKEVEISAPMFSTDRRWMVTSDASAGKSLWRVHHAGRRQLLTEKRGAAILDITADRELALVRTAENTVEVWDLTKGDVRTSPLPQRDSVQRGGFSSGGEAFFIKSIDNGASVIDILKTEDFSTLRTPIQLEENIADLGFLNLDVSADDSLNNRYDFITIGNGYHEDSRRWTLNATPPTMISTKLDGYSESSIALSRDGHTIWINYSDQPNAFIYCRNTITGKQFEVSERNTPLHALTYDSSSGFLLAAFSSNGGWVRLVDCQTEGDDINAPTLARVSSDDEVRFLAIDPVSSRRSYDPISRAEHPNNLFLTGSSYKIQVWGAATSGSVGPPIHLNRPISATGFTPDGKSVFAVSTNTVRLRSTTPAEAVSSASIKHDEDEPTVKARSTVTLDRDNSIITIESPDSGVRRNLPIEDTENVSVVAINSSAKRLAIGYRDGMIRLYETPFESSKPKVADHGEPISCIKFNHNGSVLLTGGPFVVKLWNAETLKSAGFSVEHALGDLAVAEFSPDNEFFAAAGGNLAQFFDIATERAIGRPLKHTKSRFTETVDALSFDDEAKILISYTGIGDPYGWRVPEVLPRD